MTSLDRSATSLPRTAFEYARTHNRLPQRALPKNKTGAFVEGHIGLQSYPRIPPLAKPRGAQTTSYSPSYARQMTQKQTVQNIRARQEWKGGFFPQPVMKKKNKQLYERIDHRPSPHLLHGLPAYEDLTKRSARNYVAASNSGVTHLEDLRSESSSSSLRGDCVDNGAEDIDLKSLRKLEEVYRKIEKEESWTHTTRHGVSRLKSGKKQSPLVIRSFRNPQNPHPVVQYTDIREARNSAKDHYMSRPPVPAPYFYSSRTLPRASDSGGSRVHLSRLSGARSSEHILAAPGVGCLTMAALGLTEDRALIEGVKGHPPPGISPRGNRTESDERGKFRVPSTTPATSIPDLQKALDDEAEEGEHVSLPGCEQETDQDGTAIAKMTEQMELSEPSMAARITLSLETVDGVSRPIDLDEEEERNRQDVLEYHAVTKSLGIDESSSELTKESS